MADILTPKQRSALMARVRGKDTKPELTVRRVAHRLGYRFTLYVRSLPGSPDIVFPKRRKAIFVHGCFWHGHRGCKYATVPKTRTEFWLEKVWTNQERDGRVRRRLCTAGWKSLVVWECQTRDVDALARKLRAFLDAPSATRYSRKSRSSR